MTHIENKKKWKKPEFTVITNAETAEDVMRRRPVSGEGYSDFDENGEPTY